MSDSFLFSDSLNDNVILPKKALGMLKLIAIEQMAPAVPNMTPRASKSAKLVNKAIPCKIDRTGKLRK
jgi:hypothetical protein